MQIAFGRVRRKTEPTGPGAEAVFLLKLTPMVQLETEPTGLGEDSYECVY